MYRFFAFIRKWPLLTCFVLVIAALAMLPGDEQAQRRGKPKTDYGVFQGEMKESEKVEDANSAFIENRLAKLDEREYKLYARSFYAALTQGKPGEVRQWTTRSAFGRVQVGETFQNSEGENCRPFSERYTIKKQTQHLSGKACRQKNGAWCKLRNESVPTCRLNDSGGLGMFFEDAKIDLHNFKTGKDRVMHRIGSWFR